LLYLLNGLYAVLCVVFVVSAWNKVVAQNAFATSLRPLRLVPDRLVRPAAVVVTVAELAIALGLAWAILAGVSPAPAGPAVGTTALGLAGLLLTVLTTGIALALAHGSEATCACFGAGTQPLRRIHLIRNGLLIGLALTGLAVRAQAGDGQIELGGGLVMLAGGALMALILIRLDDLVELFVPIRSF
jgi:hypothetical protein